MLLIRAGLSEAEADAFLVILQREELSGALATLEQRTRFLQEQVQILLLDKEGKRKKGARLGRVLSSIVPGVAGNEADTALRNMVILAPKPSKTLSSNLGGEIRVCWSRPVEVSAFEKLAEVWKPVLDDAKKEEENEGARTSVALNGLAMCLDGQGRYNEALELRRHVLDIESKIKRKKGKYLASAIVNLGVSTAGLGQLNEAAAILQRGLSAVEMSWGRAHICTGGALYDLSRVFYSLGENRNAADLLVKAEKIAHAYYGDKAISKALDDEVVQSGICAFEQVVEGMKRLVPDR